MVSAFYSSSSSSSSSRWPRVLAFILSRFLGCWPKKKKKFRCLAFATRSRGLAFPLFHFSAFPFARHCVSVWPARTFIRVTRYPLELPKIPCPQRTPPHTYFIPLVLQFFLISTPLFFYFFLATRKAGRFGAWGSAVPTVQQLIPITISWHMCVRRVHLSIARVTPRSEVLFSRPTALPPSSFVN